MFPGIDGFHWAFGHILFLSLFFAVALTILTTVASAVRRTMEDFRRHRAIEACWKASFEDLPASDRRCRHELAGRVISRTCDNAFDCRRCENYKHFAVLPATGHVGSAGLDYPEDRYYHRGHTWVKSEDDGTVTVGLDDLAKHLIGEPDSVGLPEAGEEIETNQTAWRITKNGKKIEVRSPIEGIVVGTDGPVEDKRLKIRPRLDVHDPATLRHLLRGPEVQGWVSRELERVQIQLRAPQSPVALADGGVFLTDLTTAVPDADWDTVLSDTFLEA
jgi:glycine cleavage system H lipoate-binding protein